MTNVLLLMSDQHSPHVLGCQGNRHVHTPNLDRLAQRGTRFAHAYTTSPICVPARASLATGAMPATLGCWDNSAPYDGSQAPSFGHMLGAAGVPTTTIGKLHYSREEDDTGFPDQRVPMHCLNGVGPLRNLLRGLMPPMTENREHILRAGPGTTEYTRYDREVARLACEWLADEAPPDPWALVVSWVSPHFPLIVPEEFFNLYDPADLPLPPAWHPDTWATHPAHAFHRWQQAHDEPFTEEQIRRALCAYYGLVTFLDHNIGLVLDALETSGLADDTTVIYTSDHGEMAGEHGLWWKSSMFEGSVGVPLIAAGQSFGTAEVVATPVSLIDVVPTILEVLEVPAPDLPGRSLTRTENDNRVVFAEYHDIYSTGAIHMARDRRYKLVHYADASPELFDLVEDPNEMMNLASDHAHADNRERLLDALVDEFGPLEQQDLMAKRDQQRRMELAGGPQSILDGGVKISYTPAPSLFDPSAQGLSGSVPES